MLVSGNDLGDVPSMRPHHITKDAPASAPHSVAPTHAHISRPASSRHPSLAGAHSWPVPPDRIEWLLCSLCSEHPCLCVLMTPASGRTSHRHAFRRIIEWWTKGGRRACRVSPSNMRNSPPHKGKRCSRCTKVPRPRDNAVGHASLRARRSIEASGSIRQHIFGVPSNPSS